MDHEPYETLYREFARWTTRAGLIVVIGLRLRQQARKPKDCGGDERAARPKVLVIHPGRDGAKDSDYWAPPFGALKFSELDWKWSQVHWLADASLRRTSRSRSRTRFVTLRFSNEATAHSPPARVQIASAG